MSTRFDILERLQRATLTINELSQHLGLARNAVVLPIQQLEAEGLIMGSVRKEKRAGKPAIEYTLAPGGEDVRSKAYPPFLALLMEALPEKMSAAQIESLMQLVGQKMAQQLNVADRADVKKRLSMATDFVDQLGANTETQTVGRKMIVRSFSCPLARAVRQEPCVCEAVRSFFEEATGADVVKACSYADKLVCQFEIKV